MIERTEDQGDFELGRRSIAGSWGQLVLAAVFVWLTDYRHLHPVSLWFFASLIFCGNLLRFYLGMRQPTFYPGRRKLWRNLFAPTIWVSGLAWGLLFFGVLRNQGLIHPTTTVALLIGSGTSAAIITSVSPNRRLALAFITFIIGIPFIALLMRMRHDLLGLPIIFVTYYVFLVSQLSIHHHNFWEGVRNRTRITEQRNRLQTVVDAIPGLVSWLGPDLRHRGVNGNYAAKYGDTREAFLGKTLGYRNRDYEFVQAVRQFVTSPVRQSTLEIPLHAKGSHRWHLLVMRKSNVQDDGENEETYVICIDIHELKQAQFELEQQRIGAELASKLAALGEITTEVAHELRNPLSVVVTSVELIKREMDFSPIDQAKIRALSDRALSTIFRMNKLIDRLKGFSRKTAGEPFIEANLHQLIQDSIDLVENHYKTNNVSLHVEPVDPALTLFCRPVEISQVLVNLLNNAMDAARRQERRWVHLGVKEKEGNILLSVVDSGLGIPEKTAEQMFSPFFTTKPRGSGTGLGLSISRRIMERHGGSVEFDPSARNTTFVVRLPIARLLRKGA